MTSATSFLTGIGSIVGIVLGVVALRQMKREPDRYEGRGLAIAGVAIGAVIVIGMLLVLIALVGSVVACDTSNGGAWPDGCY